ncbi:uncharacterized protein LOC132630036 isoform X2 [Lycium barbarum]|uniref:uncharacterized protein LOC132630036 isoform X2 n=1 Tax=Lycium barbarum TaxID=112863 RepID=UPI00293F554F|nr:uncharacterized protein LOC132630036 isoform X2 [Lycium barbarum]
MEMEKKKKKKMTGYNFKQLFKQQAKQRSNFSENAVKRVAQEEDHHEQVAIKDANRVKARREKQTSENRCSESAAKRVAQEQDHHEDVTIKDAHRYTLKSKFIEYWVPVKLSNEQIEQYCLCLVSNSAWLRSCLKNDMPSSPHDILVSTRKSCDHPYLEDDGSLHDIVMKGKSVDQQFDAEIKLSGKMELLYNILQEIKQQGQRVLILFRCLGRSGVISVGDILDDIVYRIFGEDSYTRISENFNPRMKEAAFNKFNNKGSGKFAVLMETRACSSSVKLLGIDIVVLFNSDWDPNNDLRYLQKISVYSQLEHIKLLRLYSCFTVEEKALILAKQGLTIDSTIENVKQAACRELLTWGASYLFNMHDCFHVQSSISKRLSEVAALDDVFTEFLGLMSSNCENSDYNSCSKILKVQQNGGTYTSKISLLGELELQRMNDDSYLVRGLLENESPQVFWTNLLCGRVPRWKHLPSPSGGVRRKVRFQGDLYQPSKGEQVSEKEGNKVHLTPVRKLRTKRKLHVQGKRHKLGTSHFSDGNKHKFRRLATDKVQSQVCSTMVDQHPSEISSMQSNQPPDANTSASTHRDQAHQFVPTDLQLEDSNWPIDSSIQQSTGNLPLQQNTSIDAVNGSSMRSRNNHEDQCRPDASPNTPNLSQSPYVQPLQTEMERIQKERGHINKLHEDRKLLLKSEFEKELDLLKKKYDLLHQIAEMDFARKQKELDTIYDKVHVHKLLAEAMTQVEDTADTFDVVGKTITGTGQSSPNRPSSVPAMTASISEPVNSEHPPADPQISSENFPMAAIPSPNAEFPRMEESAVVPRTSARATLQTESSANLPRSGSHVSMTPTPNYQSVILTPSTSFPCQRSIQTLSYAKNPGAGCEQRRPAPHLRPFRPLPTMNSCNSSLLPKNSVHNEDVVGRTIAGTGQSSPNIRSSIPAMIASISEPVNSEHRAADPQISFENFPMAAIPSPNAEFPRVEESAVVPRTSARATLQTESFANLPTSGSHISVTPTLNYQSVILTPSTSFPSQLPIQTLSYAANPGAGCEQRRSAPYLRPFRALPTMNSCNSSLFPNNLVHNEGDETSHWYDQIGF